VNALAIVLALSLGPAAGFKAGTPTPTSDVSNNRVRATGSTTARALRDRAADVVNVKDYGAVGDWNCTAHSGTNDTAAVAAARAAAASTGAALFFPPGNYGIDATALNFAGAKGFRVLGSGIFRTTLCAAVPGHVLEVSGSIVDGASYTKDIEVAHLSILGYGAADATTAHGVYVHDLGPYGGPSHLHLHDLRILDFSGSGVYLVQEWHTTIERISVGNTGGHNFDIQGGNTTTMQRCYAHNVAAGKAGYRIHGGEVVMIGCNGVDSNGAGSYWGLFGDNVADDGGVNYARPTLIGCNVENAITGLRFKLGSSPTLIATNITSKVNTADVKAITWDDASIAGGVLIGGRLSLGSGGNWSNGTPWEVLDGGPPFIAFWSTAGADQAYWDASASTTVTLPTLKPLASGYARGALNVSKLSASTAISAGRVAVTYGASMTIDASAGNEFVITPTNGTAFTIQNPTSQVTGQRITIRLVNTTGGALGTVTWGSQFKMAAWTSPADGNSRAIDFQHNGTNWIEAGRTSADIPN
jgi:hypothetical protein